MQFEDILTGNTLITSVVLYEMNENEISSELYGFHSFVSQLYIASVFFFRDYLHIGYENHMNSNIRQIVCSTIN